MRNILKGEKHFTASVWILTKSIPKKVLLVHHKKYDKWIQPGGHIERFENPIDAAIREVKEETGLDIGFLKESIDSTPNGVTNFLKIPDFLLEQRIPSREAQPEHFHLDLQYVVQIEEKVLKYNISESKAIGWFTKHEAMELPTHEDTKIVLHKIL